MSNFEAAIDESMGGEILTDAETIGEEVFRIKTGENAINGENRVAYQVGDKEVMVPDRVTFVDHLKSPIIELLIGEGDAQTILTAHQALLVQSPFFDEACSQFSDHTANRRIELPNEDLDAMGCFLEYLYTGEYFPQKISGERALVKDPTMPDVDETGEQLLKHAKVYTLADKLGLGALKTLAHSKIHCVNSNAKGEIVYARYVYATTPKEDDTIRKPVASFWANRSHVLRREAEDEFRQMCLEFPQFGFDVLTRVLDEKLRKEGGEKSTTAPGSSRKRPRMSQG